MVNDPDCEGIEFRVYKKDFCKIEQKNNIRINVFCYEDELIYPIHISNQKFKSCIDLLLIINLNKPQNWKI